MNWVKSVTPNRRKAAGALLATSLLAVGLMATWVGQSRAAAGINKQINFQGKVVNANGTNVTNGSYTFVFKIYDDASLGGVHELWSETKSLTVTDGIFQTNLGSSTSLPGSVDFNTDTIYLGINFNSDGEMTPRIRFTAAAYAFNSDRLGGLTAASFAQLSPVSAQAGSLNVTGSVQAATSLQAPLVDTATAAALNIGTGTATSVTIGRTTTPFLVQGNSSSTFTATNGSFTTTVGFTTPTANNSISFPNAGGTICTTVASTCNTTYAPYAASGYLAKNAADTSSFAVTASNYLYGFTNSSSAVASGVLKLDNGTNTGNGLYVTASGNPGASSGLIVANTTAGSPSGNLLDLQKAGTGVFTVDYNGSLTQSGGSSTTQTINGQRISSAANFTGTVTAATSFLSTLLDTPSVGGTLAIGTTNATGGINLNQNVTVAAGKTLGLSNATGSNTVASVTTTGDTNPRLSIQASGQLAWGAGNAATDVTLSRTGATAMQGSGTWTFTGGVAVGAPSSQYGKLAVQVSTAANAGIVVRGTTSQTGDLLQAQEVGGATLASIGANGLLTLGRSAASGVTQTGAAAFVDASTTNGYAVTLSTAALTGNRAISLPNEAGTICIQSSANCGFVVGTSTSFLARNAADTSTINATGNLYGLSNTNTGAAGVLSLANSGTNAALAVSSSGNPTSGQAVILATNSNGTPSGNLLDLRVTAGSRFSVDTSGNATATTSIVTPTHTSADVATGTSADATFRSGNGTAGNASTGSVVLKSGNANGTGSSGNVTIDTGTKGGGVGSAAGNAYLGNSNAANVVVGRNAATASGVSVSIQGLAATSNIIMNNAANTASTTIGFQAPTANVTYEFAAASTGTYQLCSTYATTCATTYAAYTANGYLAKSPGSTESSSSSIAGNQYSFANTNGGAAGVLSLANSGTNSALSVSSAANPTSGQAVILATNSNGTPSGNLLDLRVTAGSRFSVDAAGAVTTSSTINGQTISSAANFTGTVTSASTVSITSGGLSVTAGGATITAGGLTVTAGGASINGGLNNNSGGISGAGAVSGATSLAFTGATADITGARDYTGTGTVTGGGAFKSADSTTATSNAVSLKSGDVNTATNGFNTGSVTVDSGARTGGGSGTTGAVNIGNTNASAVTVGNTSAPFTVQGTAGGSASKIIFGNTTINAASSATVATYQFAAPTAATTYTICTTDTNSCGAGSTGYLRKGVAAESSSAGVTAGSYLYNFSNTGGVQSDVLQLDNGAGTGSTLKVTAAASAAANNALIYVNNTLNNATGNLIDLVSTQGGVSASRLSVSTTGAITGGTFNGQTISATANFTGTVGTGGLLTANSLAVTNGATFNAGATINNTALTVNAGASVTGGINNNAGGITNAGAVSGLTSLQFNTAGTIDANSAVSISIGTSQASTLNIGRAGATLSLQGNTSTSLTASNGTNTTSLQFANPTANVIYQFATAPANTYQICTTYASTCSTTYAAYYAGGYVQLAPGTAQADASANPSIFISKTAAGYLARLQNTGTDVFSVHSNGTLTSSGIAYLGGTSASYVAQVDTANFKVRIGTGTPTRGSEGANSTAGLYVSGATEAAGLVLIGTTTNGASFDATNHELTLAGNARHTRRVSLAPEYPGAVMTPSGSSNTGLMTSDFCSGSSRLSIPTSSNPCASTDEHNYYKWVSANSSTQTYDIYVRYLLPTDFSAFTGDNTIYMSGYRTTSSDSVALAIYQPNGTICGSSTNIATGTAAWTENTVTAPIATTCAASFTANSMVTFRVRLTSTSTVNAAMAGEIRFDYRSIY